MFQVRLIIKDLVGQELSVALYNTLFKEIRRILETFFFPGSRRHKVCHRYCRTVQSPFVIGPGFQPIPEKTVQAIVSGEYIELGNLLLRSAQPPPSGPSTSVDGRVVVSSTPKPPRRLTDILLWCQASQFTP